MARQETIGSRPPAAARLLEDMGLRRAGETGSRVRFTAGAGVGHFDLVIIDEAHHSELIAKAG